MIFTSTCDCPVCSRWRTERYLLFREQGHSSEWSRFEASQIDSSELMADSHSLHTIHNYYGQYILDNGEMTRGLPLEYDSVAVPSPNLENDWRPLTDWSPDLGQGMLIEELLDESTLQWLEKMKEKK